MASDTEDMPLDIKVAAERVVSAISDDLADYIKSGREAPTDGLMIPSVARAILAERASQAATIKELREALEETRPWLEAASLMLPRGSKLHEIIDRSDAALSRIGEPT